MRLRIRRFREGEWWTLHIRWPFYLRDLNREERARAELARSQKIERLERELDALRHDEGPVNDD